MKRAWAGAILGLLVWGAGAAGAAGQTPLFSDNSELQAVIEGPISTIVRTARRNTDPHPGAFILTNGAEQQRFDITISARGVFRRTRGVCAFPPLRLDFDRDAVRGTIMRGQNRIKLVTRCRASANYEQLIVLEYLAYRLYNELTPASYRVRPVRVTYRETTGNRRESVQFNFLVEDIDDLARRNGRWVALDAAPNQYSAAQLDPAAAARFALFQFMIGNLDWDMVTANEGRDCCHNTRLIAPNAEAASGIVPAPYDFDHSGFVDAPYATPPEGVDVSNVRQRHYRGYCMHNDHVRPVAEHFRARRSALLALIDSEQRLRESRRTQARRYIEGFFALIDDPARFEREIIAACRGRSGRGNGNSG